MRITDNGGGARGEVDESNQDRAQSLSTNQSGPPKLTAHGVAGPDRLSRFDHASHLYTASPVEREHLGIGRDVRSLQHLHHMLQFVRESAHQSNVLPLRGR